MELELLLKAGEDGKSVGDCPFAHHCRLVAALRGLPLKATPLSQSAKPRWHLENYGGGMPCLVIGGDTSSAVLESGVIAERLNGLPATDFPPGVVGPPLDASTPEADAAVSGLFPAIARFLKNTTPDAGGDDAAAAAELAALEAALTERLLALNAHLERMVGATMAGGASLGVADAALAPKLYHLSAAGAAFHPRFMREAFSATVDVEEEGGGGSSGSGGGGATSDPPRLKLGTLKAYMDAVFAHPAFVESGYPASQVVWGWGNARK